MTTAIHTAKSGVVIQPVWVKKRLELIGKDGSEAFKAQGRSKNVDDVFHY